MRGWIIAITVQYSVYFLVSFIRAVRRGQKPGSATKRILARSLPASFRYAAVTALSVAVATLIWVNAWAGLFSGSTIEALKEDRGGVALLAGLIGGGFVVYLLGWRLRFTRPVAPARVLAAGAPTINQAGGWTLPCLRIMGWGLALGGFEATRLASEWHGMLSQPMFWAPAAVCAALGFFLLIATTKREVAALAALTRPLAWVPPAPPLAPKEASKPAGRTRSTPRAAPRRAPTRRATGRDPHAPRRERPLRAAGR